MLDAIEAAKEVDAICYQNGSWTGYANLETRGLISKACILHMALKQLKNHNDLTLSGQPNHPEQRKKTNANR